MQNSLTNIFCRKRTKKPSTALVGSTLSGRARPRPWRWKRRTCWWSVPGIWWNSTVTVGSKFYGFLTKLGSWENDENGPMVRSLLKRVPSKNVGESLKQLFSIGMVFLRRLRVALTDSPSCVFLWAGCIIWNTHLSEDTCAGNRKRPQTLVTQQPLPDFETYSNLKKIECRVYSDLQQFDMYGSVTKLLWHLQIYPAQTQATFKKTTVVT